MAPGKHERSPLLVPGGAPFFRRGGPDGCLLLHGFTSMPEEMEPLGDYLAARGYTVLGQRLAGHGTHPDDLARTRWTDWLVSVADGLALLSAQCERAFLVGQSLGGILALIAAAHFAVDGVVGLSTPFLPRFSRRQLWRWRLAGRFGVSDDKGGPEARHPALGVRREAAYPAYAQTPSAVLPELAPLGAALRRALPAVTAPVLLVQSDADAAIPPDSLPQLQARLGAARVETLWVEGMDHALTFDPQRDVVFAAVAAFLQSAAPVIRHATVSGP